MLNKLPYYSEKHDTIVEISKHPTEVGLIVSRSTNNPEVNEVRHFRLPLYMYESLVEAIAYYEKDKE
jgi:hypothetical protein